MNIKCENRVTGLNDWVVSCDLCVKKSLAEKRAELLVNISVDMYAAPAPVTAGGM